MMEKSIGSDNRWLIRYSCKLLLSVILFIVTYAIVLKLSFDHLGDYDAHIEWALDLFAGVNPATVYPFWHFCVRVLYGFCHLFIPVTPEYIAAYFTGAVNVTVYLIVSDIIKNRGCPFSELISFPLMFVTPIYLPWYNRYIYLGQVSPNTWHSPTALMIRPFAVLAFFMICDICEKIRKKENISLKSYISLLVVLLLGVLSKPVFFQSAVPALGIYIVVILIHEKAEGFKKYLFLVLTFVPSFVVVLFQFIISFYSDNGSGVGFGWMEVWKHYAGHPLFSMLIALMFPFLYILLNCRTAFRDISIRLSSLLVLSGFLEFAILYEKGDRKNHLNFSWALNLSYFLIWIATSCRFFSDLKIMEKNDRCAVTKYTVLLIVWLVHFACGIYYAGLFLFREGFAF